PIEGLMDTAMSNIKSMVDVNTVVGTAVTTPDGTMIIPVSTVSFGFGAGGCDFDSKKSTANPQEKPNFGGGCGGGANVKPIAFLVVGGGNIKLLPITDKTTPVDKIIELVPEVVDKVNNTFSGAIDKLCQKKDKKKSEKEEQKEKPQVVDVAE
ncbi:MAG: GerW family sporulation protein, partial [Clostridiales bacterium]|nr:GerW family sporulation protein [Clostridiales bacterium]